MTEKFWRVLNTTLSVPIVMGGADYEQIAPPNSYLDVRNFTSPRRLAEYLIYLDDHPSEYAKYHAWRRDFGVVYRGFDLGTPSFCRLCAALHDEDRVRKESWHVQPHRRDVECEYKKWNFDSVLAPNS